MSSVQKFEQTKAAILLTLQATPESQYATTLPPVGVAAVPPSNLDPSIYVTYSVQSGDTLSVVAARFGIDPNLIQSSTAVSAHGLLPIGLVLGIPRSTDPLPNSKHLLNDSEVVNAPCAHDFDLSGYIANADGWLNIYHQQVNTQDLSGAEIVQLVAENTSVNPRFLLAFIEYRSGGVLGFFGNVDNPYPLEMETPNYKGLYLELSLAAKLINIGYYGWRQGNQLDLPFQDGSSGRIDPQLNPGSVGVQYLFARLYPQLKWEDALYGPQGFLETYHSMFGDANPCSAENAVMFSDNVEQPELELPFAAGEPWALTGGLHNDWNTGTPMGALDFAPITGEKACSVSSAWVRASADGIVSRVGDGVLTLSLVDENADPTGWELLYMHIAQKDRIPQGTLVHTDAPLGHPSCEGGSATGTHVHIARLYHGEWIGAGDPFPFVLSGWMAMPGEKPFLSSLIKGEQIVDAKPDGSAHSTIIR